jgi:hypothetical protein
MKTLSTLHFLFRVFQSSFLAMKKLHLRHLFLLLWLAGAFNYGYSQQNAPGNVTGTVTDALTGETIPFANVYFKQSPQAGTQTSLEGKFSLKRSKLPGDNLLIISFLGYQTDTIEVAAGPAQALQIKLKTASTQLKEVVISSGENPAYAIIRKAVANKNRHNQFMLPAYEMESYNRVELYLNRTEGIKDAKIVKEVKTLMERQTGNKFRDAKGEVIIPLAVVETVSNNYFLKTPYSTKEEIVQTKTTGIGIEPEDGLTQLLSGNGFRNYNFYQNRIQILDKWVASPLADGWKFNYEYWLDDSLRIGDEWLYKISVEPRRETDIAFVGTIWVSNQDYGLSKVDLRLTKNANINFVESLHIRQETEPDASGAWFPAQTDYDLNLVGISKKFPGVKVKIHTTHQQIATNQPKPLSFFLESRNQGPATPLENDDYWVQYRETATDSTPRGNETFLLIDSIKELPIAKKYAFWGRTFTTGFIKVGKVDLGHMLFSYAWNNVEGNRMTMGLRTNSDFSKHWYLEGWGGYGSHDKRVKYNLSASYILSRKNFSMIGIRRKDDTEPIANIAPDYNTTTPLKAFNRWGELRSRNPYTYTETSVWIENEIRPGFGTKVTARNTTLEELYARGLNTGETLSKPEGTINTTEVEMAVRFNKKEVAIRNRNHQLRQVGAQPSPTFTLTGTLGFRKLAGSEFKYQKIGLNIAQKQVSILGFGTAEYTIQAGYVFSSLPYSLLKVHQGNNTPFMYKNASQGMQNFEFVSDHYVEMHYTHYFNNLILSQIPGFKQLNKHLDWRLLATTSVVWGGMRENNVQYNMRQNQAGESLLPFQTLSRIPYVEVGYGVENIFRFLRVDFVHRLTYLNNPGVSRFGIKLSGNLKL